MVGRLHQYVTFYASPTVLLLHFRVQLFFHDIIFCFDLLKSFKCCAPVFSLLHSQRYVAYEKSKADIEYRGPLAACTTFEKPSIKDFMRPTSVR
jgi:hypothetical protein